MVYVGHPKWFRPQITEFVNKYGTPNYGTESSTCAYALMMANQCNFGQNIMLMPPDFGRCRTLVVWGVNPLYSNSVKGGAGFLHAVDRGAKVIVVDPKCTPTTEYAQLHLRPIPGTDGALALGMARVIITENLHDCEYIEKYTYGYEEYRDYVMDFTPEKVEEITGVPKSDMIRTARMIAAEGPTSIMLSASPVVHNINGVQNGRAIGLLMALYYMNLFKILCGLVEVALLRALEYQEAAKNMQYVEGTHILKTSYFMERLETFHAMQDEMVASYILLRLEHPGKSKEEADQILQHLIRANDVWGISEEGELYLILSQTDKESLPIVSGRLKKAGIITYETGIAQIARGGGEV